MGMNIFNNKVIARFAFRQMHQAIFKLNKRTGSSADALKISFLDALTRRAVRGMTVIRRHDLKAQTGRSMIEMLGVLAIIGVLSVGGLIGYSKAMERYRVNETVNQITHIVQNTRDLFKTQPNLYGAMDFANNKMSNTNFANRQLADKAKIFPTALVKNDYKNLFGGEIYYIADGRFANDDGKAFTLTFIGIPQEACIELATRDWQSGLGLVAMKIQGSAIGYSLQDSYSGNCTTRYKKGVSLTCGKDMPVSIEYVVAACDNEKDNSIAWKFY